MEGVNETDAVPGTMSGPPLRFGRRIEGKIDGKSAIRVVA